MFLSPLNRRRRTDNDNCVLFRNQSLDLLVGDGPLLDYYRGADSACNLIDVSNQDKIGDDTYAVAMTKGFPLKVRTQALMSF
jgi:hypothetical protein